MLADGRSAQATPTVTRNTGSVFYIDQSSSPQNIRGNYVVYKITNDGTARSNVWVKLDMPAYGTAGNVTLAQNEDGLVQVGAMAAEETKTVFFYVYSGLSPGQGKSTSITDSHNVIVYEGNPNRAATQLSSTSFSFTAVQDTLQASANKINTITTTSNPQLGGIVEVKITSAETGQTGNNSTIFISPASFPDWLANKFELFSTSITFTNTKGVSKTYTDTLTITDYSDTADYTTVFKFRAVGTTSSSTVVSPTMEISSGGQIKHSPVSGYTSTSTSFPPIGVVTSNLTLQKLVSTSQMASGGTVTYTVRVTNNGSQDVTIQDFVDTLPTSPATTTYKTGTSKFNSAAISDPTSSGGKLIWGGSFTVPAGTSRDLTYDLTIPSTEGTYTNTAVAHIGDVQIDTTSSTSDNSPATATVQVIPLKISGTVFEDVNYGGGAGRNLSTAQTSAVATGFDAINTSSSTENNIGIAGAIVEIYNSGGTLLGNTTTDQDGAYTFNNSNVTGGLQASTTYKVRVVNNSTNRLISNRAVASGETVTPIAVQTFRTSASGGTVTPVTNEVGGASPSATDDALTSVLTGALSVATVQTSTIGVTGIDFGFNFDTIVNTNNSGQGSLRQFITNSNALANTNLNQVANSIFDPAAGDETSIFMIPSGQLTSGVADINITSVLPPITGANTMIDGRTQTANIGDNNNITLGTGGTVGVEGLTLSQVSAPEVQIRGTNGLATGLDIQANNVRVQGIAIYGFGTTMTTNANINVGSSASSFTITGNVIGTTATSFTDIGTSRSGAYGIYSTSTSGNFNNNLIGFNGRGGIEIVASGAVTTTIENNEIRGNSIYDSRAEGTNMGGNGGGVMVRGNLFVANGGPGIDTAGSTGGNTYVNNTVTNNGLNITGQSNPQTPGIRIQGTNNVIDRNIIFNNYGAGILVRDIASNTLITKNSIYGNGTPGTTPSGQIGIDLVAASGNGDTGTAPFVTLNDGTTTSNSGNSLLDFPVFTSSVIKGANLELTGYARPGATIELFIADPDASGFGEGKTYLTTLTEGTVADTDSGTGSYSGAIKGINSGSDSNANKFKFSIPLSSLPGVSTGTKLTATTTIGNATSEFSGSNTVVTSANVLLVKRITGINGDRAKNPNEPAIALNTVVDNPATTNDNNANWPSNFLIGAYNGGKIKPGDEIEYTVYFMNATGSSGSNVKLCDRVVGAQTFVNNAYGTGNDIEYQLGTNPARYLTQGVDTSRDRAYFDSNTGTISGCPAPSITGTNNGTVVIDITGSGSSVQDNITAIPGATGQGTPTNSYGYFRFKTKVNE